jgi:cobalt-precorrin-5B (C1)-methyltransferase
MGLVPPRYIYAGKRKLRCGFTTGSCAAMAANAAARMLLTGNIVSAAAIETPDGMRVEEHCRMALSAAASAKPFAWFAPVIRACTAWLV